MIACIALIIVNGNVFTWEISKQDLGSKAGVHTTFCRLWQNQPFPRGKVCMDGSKQFFYSSYFVKIHCSLS